MLFINVFFLTTSSVMVLTQTVFDFYSDIMRLQGSMKRQVLMTPYDNYPLILVLGKAYGGHFEDLIG